MGETAQLFQPRKNEPCLSLFSVTILGFVLDFPGI